MTARQEGDFQAIPIIDLALLQAGTLAGLEAVAQQIDRAYAQVGFGYLLNHGVDQALIDALFGASRDFHALPRAKKLALEVNKLAHVGR